MTIFDSIKNAWNSVADEIAKIPHALSVVVAGTEHAVGEGYSSFKSVVSDSYGAGKTVVSDVYSAGKTAVGDVAYGGLKYATSSEHLLSTTEKDLLSPVTSTIQSFSYPVMLIGGALGFYIIYEMSQTSRVALPYAPQIIESGAKAGLFMV